MNQLDAMRVFVRVAELSGFAKAADSLGLPRSAATAAVQRLESVLGARLLNRTTRNVALTQDGLRCYRRCKQVLADLDDLGAMFQEGASQLHGRLRADMPVGLAGNILAGRLGGFLQAHPGLEIELSCTDSHVDLLRDGFDCVVRVGALGRGNWDSRLVGRMPVVTCASPEYIARKGRPECLADLADHDLIRYVSALGGPSDGWEYWDGAEYSIIRMGGRVSVDNSTAYLAACLGGLGLIQAPLTGMRDSLDKGLLLQVMENFQAEPMSVHLLYAAGPRLPKRVTVFMDWVEQVLRPHLV